MSDSSKTSKRANFAVVLHGIQYFKGSRAKEQNLRTQFIPFPATLVDCNNNLNAGKPTGY